MKVLENQDSIRLDLGRKDQIYVYIRFIERIYATSNFGIPFWKCASEDACQSMLLPVPKDAIHEIVQNQFT